MKIGIITHHYINNFGAFMQAYALRKAVSNLYPNDEVEIINYVNRKHALINTCGWFRFYKERENIAGWMGKIKLPQTFARCRKREMVLSHRCYTAEQVNRMGYDCIIVGSDEVWNYSDKKSFDPVKYGIGLECNNLLAYAPSVGKTSGEIPSEISAGIKKFNSISSRDDLTVELIKQIRNEDAQRVLDPTFLVEFPQVEIHNAKKPYILFYYCENLPHKVKQQIFDYAKANGLMVYGAGECDKNYDDITVNLTPFEWNAMFRDAEFVFTGTFHGVVFSILNKRPFKVFLSNESRIKKVGALLKEFNILNREITEDYTFDLESQRAEIDYESIYKIIDEKRECSKQYLLNAIGK